MNLRLALLLTLVWLFTHHKSFAQCVDSFPDPASSHDSNGSIHFGSQSRLIGGDTEIDVINITSTQANDNTCVTAACSSSGNASDSIALAAFESSTSSANITLANDEQRTIATGDYNQITVQDRAALTFTGTSTTRISTLTISNDGDLHLVGGTYWIENLVLRDRANITIASNEQVQLFVETLTGGNDMTINTDGSSSAGQLFLGLYTSADFGDRTDFNGFVYSDGDIDIGNDSTFNGAINSVSITLGDRASITYDNGELSNLDNLGVCGDVDVLSFYKIEHPSSGVTCEASEVTLSACIDASCNLFSLPVSISFPQGDGESQSLSFIGQTTVEVARSTAGTETLNVTPLDTQSTPVQSVDCSNGCNIDFSEEVLLFVDTSSGNSTTLPDIVAESSLSDIGIRAVKDNAGVCETALEGPQTVSLGFDCRDDTASYSSDICTQAFAGVAVSGDGSGESMGDVSLTFDSQGVANLSGSYADAGRLQLTASVTTDDFTITSGDGSSFDSYPSYLKLEEDADEAHIAGEPFTFTLGAYGSQDSVLPGYSAGNLQFTLQRSSPTGSPDSGKEATLTLSSGVTLTSGLSPSFADISGSADFSNGEYSTNLAENDEVGTYILNMRDESYLGNELVSNGTVTLGRFIPARFDVEVNAPNLEATCSAGSDTFSYLGQYGVFEVGAEPIFTVTAYNANGEITVFYSDDSWMLSPTLSSSNYADQSAFGLALSDDIDSASVAVSEQSDYDGNGEILIEDLLVRYDKQAEPDESLLPFDTDLNMTINADFFTDSDSVCYRPDYIDENDQGECEDFVIENIGGAEQRYGRLKPLNTYGPEDRPLRVRVRAEYLNQGNWLLNADDSCTSIALSQTSGDLIVSDASQGTEADISSQYSDIEATNPTLEAGRSGLDDFVFPAPSNGERGSVVLEFDPSTDNAQWAEYLNVDWNGDGVINNNDIPTSKVSFGLFRGNDRIFHVREVN